MTTTLRIMIKVITLLSLLGVMMGGADPKKVMRELSVTIGNYVLEYRNMTSLSQDIIETFREYWRETTPLDDPNMGCVVMWVLQNLQLLESEGKLKVDNAKAFLAAKGSDEFTSEAITKLYDLCFRSIDVSLAKEECNFGLTLAQCFRKGIIMMQWAPDSIIPDAYYEFDEYAE